MVRVAHTLVRVPGSSFSRLSNRLLMKKVNGLLIALLLPVCLLAQPDSTINSLSFTGDFRFRVEQDWNSRKSDGSYRKDRLRMRYRARFGVYYQHRPWVDMGLRIRTGQPDKQQDPQLTLGDGFGEFSTLPIAFEHAYLQFTHKWLSGWLGKNTFPFEKQNELFWSDNVFPDGIAVTGTFEFPEGIVQCLQAKTGHFIMTSTGRSLDTDSYFQGIQLVSTHWQNRLKLFPAFYYFRNVPNIPDGNETYYLNYSIMHLGAMVELIKTPRLRTEIDYYVNTQDLTSNDSIPAVFADETHGLVLRTTLGSLEKKGNWLIRVTFQQMERFAAVDFLAQNDWARWDYSAQGSPDGRLTNYRGIDIMTAYALANNMDVQIRFFKVNQIVPLGDFKENGNRIRFDVNIAF